MQYSGASVGSTAIAREPHISNAPFRDTSRLRRHMISAAQPTPKKEEYEVKKIIFAAKKLSAVALMTLAMMVPAWSQNADVVLLNGKIVTVDSQFSIREALAVR